MNFAAARPSGESLRLADCSVDAQFHSPSLLLNRRLASPMSHTLSVHNPRDQLECAAQLAKLNLILGDPDGARGRRVATRRPASTPSGRPPHIMIPHPALSQVRGEPRAEGPGCGAQGRCDSGSFAPWDLNARSRCAHVPLRAVTSMGPPLPSGLHSLPNAQSTNARRSTGV